MTDHHVSDAVRNMETENESLRSEIDDLETELERRPAEDAVESLEDQVHALLDLVERPVGSLAAMLPASPAASRALIALHDAIGRRI